MEEGGHFGGFSSGSREEGAAYFAVRVESLTGSILRCDCGANLLKSLRGGEILLASMLNSCFMAEDGPRQWPKDSTLDVMRRDSIGMAACIESLPEKNGMGIVLSKTRAISIRS